MDNKYVTLSVILFVGIFALWIGFLYEGIADAGRVYCTPESREGDVCLAVDDPVCGWFSEDIKCFAYPCAADYSNPCMACLDEKVEYWTEGGCPPVG